mmetsp:Transcript_15130/g.30731  ORF Transcript_15130/g.30731 Transcript_15130/m.30731 type:complete len:123 (+) Transcript_15130:1936-2304(+)
MEGSPANTPVVVEIGTGCDLHGQDATKASLRAVRQAMEFNSLPGLVRLLPRGDLSEMEVRVTLGVPLEFCDSVDEGFPYGSVQVEVVPGGLPTDSGVILVDQGDKEHDSRSIVVIAAIHIFV